jgi:hypothetical protein
MARPESTPKDPRIIKDKIDLSNWREKVKKDNNYKFDDKKKIVYLQQLFEHGKKLKAAYEADITYGTVQYARENDEDFAAIEEAVIELRSQNIIARLEKEAMEGYDEPIVNKHGDIVGYRTRYETQLRAMLMKRYDDNYKDRTDINLSGELRSGVLILPEEAGSLDEILKEAQAHREQMLKDQAEAEAEEVNERED